MLAQLKAERLSQRSYFGFLSLDLLDYLCLFLPADWRYFQGRLVKEEALSHQLSGYNYAQQNENYLLIESHYDIKFFRVDGHLIRTVMIGRATVANIWLKGHLARFWTLNCLYTLNLQTNVLIREVRFLPSFSSCLVRDHHLLVLATPQSHLFTPGRGWTTIPYAYDYGETWFNRHYIVNAKGLTDQRNITCYNWATQQTRKLQTTTNNYENTSLHGHYFTSFDHRRHVFSLIDLRLDQVAVSFCIDPRVGLAWSRTYQHEGKYRLVGEDKDKKIMYVYE